MALPQEVLQGLGWVPPAPPLGGALPADPIVAPAPESQPPPPMPQPELTPPPELPAPQLPERPAVALPPAPNPDFKAPMPEPAPPAPPPRPPKPLSVDQQLGMAQQKQAQTDAAGMGAIASNAAVDQAQAADELKAYQDRQAKADEIDKERAALQQETQQVHNQKQAYVDATLKEVDGYKVDQNKYWKDLGVGDKIGWGIGMALSGLGNAFLGARNPQMGAAENPVIKMMRDKIHESIVAQMDERDQLKEKYGRAEHALDRYDQFSKDRSAQIDLKMAQADRMLANQLMLTAAKFKDPKIAANAQVEAAKLMQSSTDKARQAAEFAAGYEIQKKQAATAAYNASISAGHLQIAKDTYKQEYGPNGLKQQALDLKAAADARKALEDKKKAAKDMGVYNPITGKGLMTEEGKRLTAQADALEARAKENPAIAPAALAKAAELRDAASAEVAIITDAPDRRKVIDGLAHAQELTDTLHEMAAFLRKDPDLTDREGWAALKTKYGASIGGYAEFIGARASSPEFKALTNHVLDYDADSMYDRMFRKGPGAASIDTLVHSIKGGVDKTLRARGITDGWTPSVPESAPTITGKTAEDSASSGEPSILQRIGGRIISPTGGYDSFGIPAERRDAALANTFAKTGIDSQLSPEDTNKVASIAAQADQSGGANREKLVGQLVALISAGAPSGDSATADPNLSARTPRNEVIAASVLNLVRDHNPGVYNDILDRLPPAQAEQIRQWDAIRQSMNPLSPENQVRSQSPR